MGNKTDSISFSTGILLLVIVITNLYKYIRYGKIN